MSVDPERRRGNRGEIEADEPTRRMDAAPRVAASGAPAEFRDYLVPLEEFRISPDARDPDDAVYIAHACDGRRCPSWSRWASTTLRPSGRRLPIAFPGPRQRARPSATAGRQPPRVLLEEYVRFDADGDGIAERLCVHRVGNTVLRIEPTDYQPFVIYCPFPMPGRIAGHSLADKVTDIQRINTALMRLPAGRLYRNLAPAHLRPDECVNENTYDDLLTVIPGGLVRYKGPPARPEPKNDVSAVAFQAIEFMIGQREGRTGIPATTRASTPTR
jgi:hypothetical protein